MSATMTAPMPSLNGSAAYAASEKAQATSLRENAVKAMALAKNKFATAWAWFTSKARTGWAALKGFLASHSTVLSMGAAGLMAVKGIWKQMAAGVVSIAKSVAKAATWATSKIVHAARAVFVTPIAWLTGLFSKTAADKVRGYADQGVQFIDDTLSTVDAYVDGTAHVATEVLTSSTTSSVVNTGAAVLAGSIAINAVTGGTVAAAVVDLPVIGSMLAGAVAGGPFTFLALGGLIVAGVLSTLFFNKGVDLSIKPAESQVIQGEALWSEATVTEAEAVITEVAEAAAAQIDPEIDQVGLEAYNAQTAAMQTEANRLADLSQVIVTGRAPAGKGKKARR